MVINTMDMERRSRSSSYTTPNQVKSNLILYLRKEIVFPGKDVFPPVFDRPHTCGTATGGHACTIHLELYLASQKKFSRSSLPSPSQVKKPSRTLLPRTSCTAAAHTTARRPRPLECSPKTPPERTSFLCSPSS
jgi:hypothetical protein